MAIAASGLYGLTLEKFLNCSLNFTNGIESETLIKGLMVTDSYTTSAANYDAHNFWDDIGANEVSGTGYTSGGAVLTSTEITVGSPAAGQTKYTSAAVSWATSTISSAMALIGYHFVTNSADSELIWLSDFVNPASSSGGTFTVTPHSNGWFYFDLTPP